MLNSTKIFFLTLFVFSFSNAANAMTVGDVAPDFKVKSISGEEKSISGFKGKIVVLEWTNHKCPFVKKHYDSDNMQALQKKYHSDEEVVWVSIISSAEGKQGYLESDGKAYELANEKGAMPNYIVRDPSGEIGRSYQAATTPHMFVIGQEGNLEYMGAIDSISSASKSDVEKAENYVEAAIQSLKSGEELKIANTRPYGCSVKY